MKKASLPPQPPSLLLRSSFVSSTSAAIPSPVADHTSELLQLTGSLPVKSAETYVEVGTYRIQVTAKLVTPTRRLTDGSWFDQDFVVHGSKASGTLLVRFADGALSELSLLLPATTTALLDARKAPGTKMKVASAQR